jgi:thiol:disulfide interchange protein
MPILRLLALSLLLLTGCGAPTPSTTTPQEPKAAKMELPPAGFDEKADPEKQLAQAMSEAQKDGKRILIKVGGNWCVWCRMMVKFFHDQPELLAFRKKHYRLLKISVSKDNSNKVFLSKYPPFQGVPHLFVLDAHGKLLKSQDSGELEKGQGYDQDKFMAFLKQWAPPKK